MSNQPFMKFEIREKVQHFKEERSFKDLTSLELQPVIKVYDTKEQVEIAGHLVLHGEFLEKEPDWENQFNNSDGIHYGSFFKRNQELDSFQYQIPITIQIQPERVSDINDIFVIIEDFDYKVLNDEEIELTAYVKLLGVHPNREQDTPTKSIIRNEGKINSNSEQSNLVDKNETLEKTNEEAEPVKAKIEKEPPEKTIDKEKKDETADELANMKIGIGKNNKTETISQRDDTKANPLYSLLKQKTEKKENGKPSESVNEKAKQEVESNSPIAKVDDNIAQAETEREEIERKNTTDPKDMLFSLLQGNEESKFKLRIYLVQKNETLEQIADKYDFRPDEIMRYNNLADRNLENGQLLYLPARAEK